MRCIYQFVTFSVRFSLQCAEPFNSFAWITTPTFYIQDNFTKRDPLDAIFLALNWPFFIAQMPGCFSSQWPTWKARMKVRAVRRAARVQVVMGRLTWESADRKVNHNISLCFDSEYNVININSSWSSFWYDGNQCDDTDQNRHKGRWAHLIEPETSIQWVKGFQSVPSKGKCVWDDNNVSFFKSAVGGVGKIK